MAPRIVTDPSEARAVCDASRARGERVAFVPTMGALHAGHLALVEEAKRRAHRVVVSIFVNPIQFGPSDDFARYPRDLAADLRKLTPLGVDIVFSPEARAIYPDGDQTRVVVGSLAVPLEGEHRPGHFEGVATIVAKLFAIVGPCVAIFGRKDYQQLLVVRRLVLDLFLPVDVVAFPIVRESGGLAMSSRNAFLSSDDRARALSIATGLDAAVRCFARGERRARELERVAREPIERADASIDYVEARDAETLAPISDEVGVRTVLVVACRVGATRLIDNVVLGEDPPPLGGWRCCVESRPDHPSSLSPANPTATVSSGAHLRYRVSSMDNRGGRFVVVEGIDGSGTTTQVARLADRLRGMRVLVRSTREPSDGPVGTLVRQVLTGRVVAPGGRSPGWATMALLFAADRMDHVESEIEPFVASGGVMLSDRYDASSLAYQSVSSGVDAKEAVEWIRALNRHVRRPHLTVVLELAPELAAERRERRGDAAQLYEQNEMQRELAAFYKNLSKHLPNDRIAAIDASGTIEDVHARVWDVYCHAFGG
jgi:pantoate--beta-alanine ligase